MRPTPRCVLAAMVLGSCAPSAPRNSIGPAGGLVASEDDGLTLVLWPGALGEFHEFEITRTESAPEAFGPAYEVSPNPALAIDAEVILRGELPEPTSLAHVGAIADGDSDGWRALPTAPQGVDENDGTVRAHDGRVSLYYALIDDEGVASTTGDTTDGTSTDTGDPTDTPVSFAADIQPIFDQSCTTPASCHGVAPSGSLSLDVDAYANIVGVAAAIDGSLTRVIAGNADDSLLMNKVDYMPPPTGGNPMPLGGQLDASVRDLIRAWIDQGCPP